MKKLIALMGFCLLVTACGKNKDGTPVPIPTVTMECAASSCKANSTFYSAIYITSYTCDEGSINFSVAASSSSNIACTAGAGCSQTFSNWVNYSGGATTTVDSGTYNLCGIVANSNFNGSWTGNVRAVGTLYGKKIDATTTSLDITNWLNY